MPQDSVRLEQLKIHYSGLLAGYEEWAIEQMANEVYETERSIPKWLPISTAPRDGTWILLAGPSSYTTVPLRVEVGRYYPEYRPLSPWQNHSNNAFTDGGPEPTHWMPLPELSK